MIKSIVNKTLQIEKDWTVDTMIVEFPARQFGTLFNTRLAHTSSEDQEH